MTATERREEIMRIMFIRRHEKISNLVSEFGVSERTIRRDIFALGETNHPIYTTQGRYGGGVHITEGCHNNMLYMKPEDEMVLRGAFALLKEQAAAPDTDQAIFETISGILDKYSYPKAKKIF